MFFHWPEPRSEEAPTETEAEGDASDDNINLLAIVGDESWGYPLPKKSWKVVVAAAGFTSLSAAVVLQPLALLLLITFLLLCMWAINNVLTHSTVALQTHPFHPYTVISKKQQSLTQERGDFKSQLKYLEWAYYPLQLLQTNLFQDVYKLDWILHNTKDKENKIK